MIETLIALIAAHLAADFLLQPDALVRRKRNVLVLFANAVIVLLVAILALGGIPVWLLVILLFTHVVMDAIKVYALPDRLWSFCVDQGMHFVVIAGLAIFFPNAFQNGWWPTLPAGWTEGYLVALCLISGLTASIQMGAILIRKAVVGLSLEIGDPASGLSNGGYLIGCLERALIMLLILMGQPGGVGFLVAAKSILRFGDVQNERKMTEYIIIGTLMSFGWGLLVASLTSLGLHHVLPSLTLIRQ